MPAHAYASAPAAVHLGGTRAARHPHARLCRAQVTPAVQVEFTPKRQQGKVVISRLNAIKCKDKVVISRLNAIKCTYLLVISRLNAIKCKEKVVISRSNGCPATNEANAINSRVRDSNSCGASRT